MRGWRIFWGSVFVVLGFVILLGNLGIIEWSRFLLGQALLFITGVFLAFHGIRANQLIESGAGVSLLVSSTVRMLYRAGLSTYSFSSLWPLMLVFVGIVWVWIFARSKRKSAFGWGVLAFLLGILFLISTLGIVPFAPGEIVKKGWAVILIALGIYYLAK